MFDGVSDRAETVEVLEFSVEETPPSDIVTPASSLVIGSTRRSTGSLTRYEVGGLSVAITMADGHAYHEFDPFSAQVIERLPEIWTRAVAKSIPQMEKEFKDALANLIHSPALEAHEYYSLCPTASNSIDVVATWLKSRDYNVGMIEPAFDNLHLITKRRGVEIIDIPEDVFVNLDRLEEIVKKNNLKSLFLVSPNNPTGFQMSEQEFSDLCNFCAKNNVALICDTTFRFYSRNSYDEYKILKDSGVDFAVIEDTGKTWPTQDLKISMLAYSASIAEEMRDLYEEIYLCASKPGMGILTELFTLTAEHGIDKVVWNLVDRRRAAFTAVLEDTVLQPVKDSRKVCPLPMVWLDCSRSGLPDEDFVDRMSRHGVALLPGSGFYRSSRERNTSKIRASLMRPDLMFERGLEKLSQVLKTGFASFEI